MAPLVDNAQIKSAQLLSPLSFHFHAYVWPFIIIWPIFLRYFLTPELYEKHIGAPEWTFVWVGSIITIQSLVWLSTHWSVELDSIFTATSAKTVEDAQLIKVIPIANAGSAEICKLVRDKASPTMTDNRRGYILTKSITGRWKDQHFVPVPKAPIPVQHRDQDLRHPQVRDRFRAKAPHPQLSVFQGYRTEG